MGARQYTASARLCADGAGVKVALEQQINEVAAVIAEHEKAMAERELSHSQRAMAAQRTHFLTAAKNTLDWLLRNEEAVRGRTGHHPATSNGLDAK